MKKYLNYIFFAIYTIFIIISLFMSYTPGIEIGKNFLSFALTMLKVVPAAFIIIGLFEVWIKKETVEKHLGSKSNLRAYFWILLLAGTTVGGMYVAFPVSAALYKKGAKLSIVFAYLSAAAAFRIPMMLFEATFLGLKFTVIRLAVSLPLIIISSELLAGLLKRSCEAEKLFTNEI